MKKIDSFLMKKFQSVSDWTQDLAGITNFFIVKYIISSLLVANEVWYVTYKTLQGNSVFIYFGSIIVMYLTTKLPSLVEKMENMVSSNPTFKNPMEIAMAEFRYSRVLPIFTFMTIFNTTFWISFEFFLNNIIFNVCLMSAIYFLCCTPKPPSKSKLKKLKEKIQSISIRLPGTSPGLSPG